MAATRWARSALRQVCQAVSDVLLDGHVREQSQALEDVSDAAFRNWQIDTLGGFEQDAFADA